MEDKTPDSESSQVLSDEGLISNIIKQSNLDKYPSGEILLSIAQKEYEYEIARKTAVETRAGVLITLLVAIVTFGVSTLGPPVIQMPIKSIKVIILYSCYYTLAILAIGTIVFSLYKLLRVFLIDEYRRLDITNFNRSMGEFNKDVSAMAIAEKYCEIVNYNQNKNDIKIKAYSVGVYSVIASIFLTLIIYGISRYF